MQKYLGKLGSFEINGKVIDDVRTVSVTPTPTRKRIELMNKDGYIDLVESWDLEVEYVIPSGITEFDFQSVLEGTAVIDRGDGVRELYGGLTYLSTTGESYDRGSEGATKTITLMATSKN